ncbi:cob(I)yrinic acid a,c-diamide adenosyltransferase [Sphingomonas aracearum]|uniref:Corrinoid adenosyltransferase n=1 Tax=Sphingomonas aracearum TaxID=2283317 RepID=A0A369VSS9_9SPHN|nr:cob(I)yrinic acid a,c-diamide adenosyltransferase [Sphingomonas aracearum]RDE04919.1 cob(I)yrinic acid a,c-diamide adenosyltransferase [Sphingomonas aracearum]
MVRLNRIYTRTGDAGSSGLADGSRLSKADARFAAIGDVDEANSAIGLALRSIEDADVRDTLTRIQNDLFDLGADLATPGEDFTATDGALRIVAAQVAWLEARIDAANAALAPLTSFILPGGSAGASALHLARAVTRRAERSGVALARAAPVNPQALAYLNRLSDLLFVFCRTLNRNGADDVLWVPGANR